MELGFWIPVVSGIPYSKAQDSGFYKQKLRGIRPEPALPYMGQDIRTVRRRIISTERRRDLVQFRARTSCLHCLHLLQNQMSTRQIVINLLNYQSRYYPMLGGNERCANDAFAFLVSYEV